jgi:tRNA 2-thiouridine synthesizing protein D
MTERTLTFALMHPPYEAAHTTTAFRLIAAALQQGINVNVFAYEGAVSLALKDQQPHANPVKGTTVEEEQHPVTKDFVSALLALGRENPRLTWINCGLCADERGAVNAVDGVKRGSPADFLQLALASTNTLVIPVK